MDVVMFLTCRAGRLAGDALCAGWPRALRHSGIARGAVARAGQRVRSLPGTEAPPTLVAELHFDNLLALEAAATARASALAGPACRPLARAGGHQPPGHDVAPLCRGAGRLHLVAYHGHAQDHDAWLGHYLDRHVPLMLRLPGLRALEVCTRLDWRGGLRWPREMQSSATGRVRRCVRAGRGPCALTCAWRCAAISKPRPFSTAATSTTR